MDLQEKKASIWNSILRYQEDLTVLNGQFQQLSKLKQPTTEDLYKNMVNDKFFKITVSSGAYEFILGGDGRSQPWSEERQGKIVTITLQNQVYLSEKQMEIVKSYIKEVYKPDHIKVA